MLIAEFHLDTTILAAALEAVPEMTVTLEHEQATGSGPVRLLLWAGGDDFDRFEAAAAADPTLSGVVHLTTTGDRRLYRVELSDQGEAVSIYPPLVEVDGVYLAATGDADGWESRVQVPDREALATFWERCDARGVDCQLRTVYEERGPVDGDGYGLSPEQHEALTAALELGYFEIPREASLSRLAAELDVSDQAASERLRRGMRSLLQNTIRQSVAGGSGNAGPA